MPVITCAQHIYGNLTTEQSPIRRRGYQTLFYTHGQLTPEAVRAIESRAQHRVTQGTTGKWQFYGLPQGLTVISYLAGVPEPDEFGRRGRYLAHSLLLDTANWRLTGSSPFSLMEPKYFCQTMQQVLALGNLKTGELAPAVLEVTPHQTDRAVALAQQWNPDELWKLARLVCHPQGILQRGHFVSFVGNEQQIYEALKVAFHLAAAPRLDCTFDTAAAGCSWRREINFWGQGFAEEREARTPFVVLAAEKKVRVPSDWSPPETPYEHWLKTQLTPRKLATIQRDQQGIYLMSSTLTGEVTKTDQLPLISVEVQNDFAKANDAALMERIERLLPKPLPPYLVDTILARIGRSSIARLQWLYRNPAGEGLGDILFDIFADWGESLTDEAQRSMTSVVSRHAGLRLLFALWARNEREIHNSVSAMNPDEYRRSLQKLSQRRFVQVHDFFCAKHLNLWFDMLASEITLEHVVAGISVVATHGTQNDWNALAAIPEQVKLPSQREALLKWLNGKSFRKQLKALDEAFKESLRTKSGSSSEDPTSRSRFFKR